MINRTYQLTDIFIEKNIDESYKCGICMDILSSPIVCEGGHSWCHDCINRNNKQICPICPRTINYTNPILNFAIKNAIVRMPCRCPYNISNNNDINSSKKRKH